MRYLLIDGNHCSGRCNAVMEELITDEGVASGVVYGFLKSLSYVKNVLKVDAQQVIICWDGGRSSKRLELYPEYKAGRTYSKPSEELTPEEIASRDSYYHQLNALYQGLAYLGIRQVRVKGVEADDLLSILSHFYEEAGHTVTIYSGDHDMYQLISDKVHIFDPKKNILERDYILQSWGITSIDQIPLYKAITGDSSDNIVGVRGIGDVRVQIALQYVEMLVGKLECPRAVDSVKDSIWVDKILAAREQVERNYSLINLPRTWEGSFYTYEQAMEALDQLLTSGGTRDSKKFNSFLSKWSVRSIYLG